MAATSASRRCSRVSAASASFLVGSSSFLGGGQPGQHPAGLGGQLQVVRIAGGVEHPLHLLVGQPVQEGGLAQRCIAAAGDCLLQDPLQALVGGVAARQRVHGVLDGDGPQPLQLPPDLHPKVGRPGRDLVDQQQPARPLLGRLGTGRRRRFDSGRRGTRTPRRAHDFTAVPGGSIALRILVTAHRHAGPLEQVNQLA
jgi:hypothetical protein